MITTTLRQIMAARPCYDGLERLLGPKDPEVLAHIIEHGVEGIDGLADTEIKLCDCTNNTVQDLLWAVMKATHRFDRGKIVIAFAVICAYASQPSYVGRLDVYPAHLAYLRIAEGWLACETMSGELHMSRKLTATHDVLGRFDHMAAYNAALCGPGSTLATTKATHAHDAAVAVGACPVELRNTLNEILRTGEWKHYVS